MAEFTHPLLELSEVAEELTQSINKAMAKFVKPNGLRSFLDFLSSLPDDIKDTETYQHIISFKSKEIIYDDILWMKRVLGYKSYEGCIRQLQEKKRRSELDDYILSIIESADISPREKLIVLLVHFEDLVYQAMTYERQSWDRVKRIMSEKTEALDDMKLKSYSTLMLAGIVFIVFSNTDDYKKEFDKRIPFRNHILHRGVMCYSDGDIKEAYDLLVYFISEIAVIEAAVMGK